jgi:hypothetical protein
MVIVSPYARPGYTDSNVASIASILAYTEYALGAQSLNSEDATAYDYNQAFDYSQTPLQATAGLRTHVVPRSSRRWMVQHPGNPRDPT